MLHRDIKPSNLLISRDGKTVYLSDFGLARMQHADEMTATLGLVGTPEYLPPEALDGRWEERGDLFSLGATLYRLLTLQPLYPDSHKDRGNLIKRVATETPPPPRSLSPHIPRDLETIVLKAMAREPEQRYRNASEMAGDLQRFLNREPITARRLGFMRRFVLWCKREPALASLTVALICSLIIGALAAEMGRQGEQRAREETNQQLGKSHLNRWNEATKSGKDFESLVWLVEAMKINAGGDTADRMRLASTLSRLPALEWMWFGKSGRLQHVPGRFSPDGRYAAVGSASGGVQVCDLSTGNPSGVEFNLSESVDSAEFSPDGRYLALGASSTEKTLVKVWDTSTGLPVVSDLEFKSISLGFSFDPTGPKLLLSMEGGFRLFDLENGGPVFPEVAIAGYRMPLAITPDGLRIVGAGRQWNAKTGQELPGDGDHGSRGVVYDIDLSPDGTKAAFVGDPFRIWNTASGGSEFRWDHLASKLKIPDFWGFFNVDYSPDGDYVAASTSSGAVIVVSLESGDLAIPVQFHSNVASDVQFSPGGDYLATAGMDGLVKVLEIPSGRAAVASIPHESPVEDIEFSPDGERLLTTTRNGIYRVWNLAGTTGNLKKLIPGATMIADNPSRQGIAFSFDDGVTRILNPETWKPQMQEFVHDGDIAHVEMSPGGVRLATVNKDGRTRVWTTADGALEFAAQGKIEPYRLRFTPDDQRLFLFYNIMYNLFDLVAKRDLLVSASVDGWPNQYRTYDSGVAFVSDRNQFVIGATGTLAIHDGKNGDIVISQSFPTRGLHPIAATGDGSLIATTPGYSTVMILDGENLETTATVSVNGPDTMAFDENGDRLAIGSSRNISRVYGAHSGRPMTRVMHHTAPVKQLVFCDLEETRLEMCSLVTLCADGVLRLWDSNTGLPLTPPWKHPGAITSLTIHEETRSLLTTSEGRLARVYAFPDTIDQPHEALMHLVELLSLRRFERGGEPVVTAISGLQLLWKTLRHSHPEWFDLKEEDILRWRRMELAKAIAGRRWYAVRFHLDQLSPSEPEDLEQKYTRAHAFAELGEWESARTVAEQILEIEPDSSATRLLLTRAMIELRETSTASLSVVLPPTQEQETNRSDAAVGALLSLLHHTSGQLTEAENAFCTSVERLGIIRLPSGQPFRTRTRRVNGVAIRSWQTVLGACQTVYSRAPDWKILRIIGLAQGALGRWKEATETFGLAAEQASGDVNVQLCRLRALLETAELTHREELPRSRNVKGQLFQSPSDFEGLDSLLESESTYWRLKGRACYNYEEWPVAVEALERAVALGETDNEVRYLLQEAKKHVTGQ